MKSIATISTHKEYLEEIFKIKGHKDWKTAYWVL